MVKAKIGPCKRGRPRTVTADQQDPEERRRIQIRLAQQAYRRRKETTITSLQTRVQELESGIETICESFLSFSDLLLKEEFLEKHPRVTYALQKVTRQCMLLAESACGEPDQPEPDQGDPAINAAYNDRGLYGTRSVDLDSGLDPQQHHTLPIIEPSTRSVPAHWPVSQSPQAPSSHDQAINPLGTAISSSKMWFSTSIPPLTSQPTIKPTGNVMREGHGTLSHSLVRECYENAYQLLLNSSDGNTKIQEIFGRQLTSLERARMVSLFYAAMHDEVGDTIERETKVPSTFHPTNKAYTPEHLALFRTWNIEPGSGSGDWLDASGVQKLLQEKGILIQGTGSTNASPQVNFWVQFNAAAFIRLLSLGPICVGRGPVFRKRDVENALRLATSTDFLSSNIVYDLP